MIFVDFLLFYLLGALAAHIYVKKIDYYQITSK